jgi:ribose 1,5-bisphosphate isomerase
MKLKEILRDTHKGAAELLNQAAAWLARHPDALDELRVEHILRTLRRTRPGMVGFSVLADRLERLLEERPMDPPEKIIRTVQKELHAAEGRMAQHFADALREHGDAVSVLTLSRSSSVLAGLQAASDAISALHVLESNPGGEGNFTCEAAKEFLDQVQLRSDLKIDEAVADADVVVFGADTVFADGAVLNKLLSKAVAEAARAAGKPCYVLATTWKCSKKAASEHVLAGDDARFFEVVPADLVSAVISEQGDG